MNNQIELVSEFIKNNLPNLIQQEDPRYFIFRDSLGEEKSLLIIQEKESVNPTNKEEIKYLLFSSDFKLLLTDEEWLIQANYYAFNFGGNFYYVKKEEVDSPKLNILRYLGENISSLQKETEFAHLGIHGMNELLNGCQKYEAWCQKAKYLGIKTLGICEKNTLGSAFKFQKACQKNNIKFILGETISVKIEDTLYDFKIYAKDNLGWKNLLNISNIINIFKKNGEERYLSLDEEEFLELSSNLVTILPNNFPFTSKRLKKYKKIDCYYQIDTVEFVNNDIYYQYLINIKRYLEEWSGDIPPVLLSDSYYLEKEDKEIQSVLRKISEDKEFRVATVSQHFKSIQEHWDIFGQFWKDKEEIFEGIFREAIYATKEIAEKCNFEIKMEKLHLPSAKIEGVNSEDNLAFFEKIIREGMDSFGFTGNPLYEDRVKEEFETIVGADLENYFLLIWDIVNFCKKTNNYTGIARGSAAGSLITYLIGITKINPFDYNLLFSRFLNAGRVAKIVYDIYSGDEVIYQDIFKLEKINDKYVCNLKIGELTPKGTITKIEKKYSGHISMPDIDLDIEDRGKIKEYLAEKYGKDRFAVIGSYNTFKIKAGIKDLSRVLGTNLDYAALNILTSTLFFKEGKDAYFEEIFKTAQENSFFKDFVQNNPNLINALYWIIDTPKSTSIHPCATMLVPEEGEDIFNSFPMFGQGEEFVCEWEGSELDELGFLKEDLLGLAQLEFLHNICNLIEEKRQKKIDIYSLPLNDKSVYTYFQNGWNSEIFQFGSNLLVNYCKLLKPTTIEDLIASVSLVRPGALNSGSHIKYARRKNGEEDINYHFGFEKFTKETFGLLVYQEQIMQIGSFLGELTLVESDGLRKCVTGDSYLWTKEGYKQFKELIFYPKTNNSLFSSLSLDLKNLNLSNQKVKSIFKQKDKKKCLRIFTTGGILDCTYDHKIWTNFGWVEAKDLTNKHFVLKESLEKFGTGIYNKDKLYLIIALITEGYLIKDLCQFTNKDKKELDRFEKTVLKVYPNKEIKKYFDKNGVCQVFVQNLQDELSLPRVLSGEKELPSFIFSLDKEHLKFIIGLLIDFDGCVQFKYKKKESLQLAISYNSKSIKLINQISLLLSQFGIEVSINEDLRERCRGNYNLNLKSSKDIHIFYKNFKGYCSKLSRIEKFIENYPNKTTSPIPYNIWFPIINNLVEASGYSRNELVDSPTKNSIAWKSKNSVLEKESILKLLTLCGRSKELELYCNNNLSWNQFIKSEDIGEKEVYDFTMNSEVSPQAFVNGILIHNCLGKKQIEKMLEFKAKILPNALEKGCSEEEFEEIWDLMVEFAKYGFNKSHAAAYSLTGYISQYLKVHYPIEFWTAAFEKANDSNKKQEKFNQYFKELQESKSLVRVVPPQINFASNKITSTIDGRIYFPLNDIKYLTDNGVESIIAERKRNGDFYSFEEFLIRMTKDKLLDKRELENLILSGVFDEVESLDSIQDRSRLIRKLYTYLKKDSREFFEGIQDLSIFWYIKQWELLGVVDIPYQDICSKYFSKYNYFRAYRNIEEDLKVTFAGILIEAKEKKTKKGKFFGEIILENNNIPYSLMIFNSEIWEQYKLKIFDLAKLKNNILCFEAKFSLNTQSNDYQLILLEDSELIFLDGKQEKIKVTPISYAKFDIVKLDTLEIGTIIKYPSNSAITIEFENKTCKIVSKENIIEIVTKYKK